MGPHLGQDGGDQFGLIGVAIGMRGQGQRQVVAQVQAGVLQTSHFLKTV
jgi:hypothetical protein